MRTPTSIAVFELIPITETPLTEADVEAIETMLEDHLERAVVLIVRGL